MTYVTYADLGGRKGLGPVVPERDEPLFHAPWEARALAITLAMGATGSWNIDQSRAAREQQPGYLGMSYYEVWTGGLERLMADRGLVTAADLAAGHAVDPAKPVTRVLTADRVPAVLARGGPTEREATSPARFAVGDRVRTATMPAPKGHTRLPRYAQGKTGTVTHLHGVHVFADVNATGTGEAPEWLYTVRFDGPELFGAEADPASSVSVDAWDSYLSPA
ncbi:nitrile hydratase subunit beta [Phreatobacter cathodiphilus]|uniref:Nitrile hydratase subunit beta n=1 Tax=Phreatobacter cathodiphilus TaxID=1868589 RepID=A0A2S0NCD2_9HYPH|nr:nitrile hydratase subunit beta [Phreatobacter cathodiphilus]AVO45822.1 nitrile hydratase subunit beta [Phreatobacter cathodiphilus]